MLDIVYVKETSEMYGFTFFQPVHLFQKMYTILKLCLTKQRHMKGGSACLTRCLHVIPVQI